MKRNDLVLAYFVVVSTVLLILLKQANVGMIFAPITFVIFAVAILFFVRTSGRAALLLVPFAVLKMSELISVVLIEFGAKMSEVGMTGRDIGASSGLLVHDLMFFMGAMVVLRKTRKSIFINQIGLSRFQSQVATFLAYGICGIGLVAGVVYGFSIFSGLDRFSFRASSGNALLGFFLSNRLVAVLLFSILSVARGRWARRGASAGFVSLIFINILHGEQLMSTISIIITFFVVKTIAKNDSQKFARKLVKIGIISLIFGFSALALSYSSQKKDVVASVAARTVLQGQLWYAVLASKSDPEEFKWDSIGRNVESFGLLSVDDYVETWPPVGVRELMYKFADTSLYNSYTENGVTFTMGTSGYLYYMFGSLGGIVAELILGVFAGAVVTMIVAAMSGSNLLLIVLSAKIYALLMLGLQQGDFWYLFGIRSIATGMLLWFAVLIMRRSRPLGEFGNIRRSNFYGKKKQFGSLN
ncbi:DUF6418 domain-containing protein [Paraburkholderia nemoris]|uniref:DUF6418 domain-containing protein n=1 Tax=Paraburkholderia nemoris TaxID=2793076 RepID=UPI0038B76DFB